MTCRWNGQHQLRLVSGWHQDECGDDSCRGCQVCPERHCGVCGKEHITVNGRGDDQTCAGCVGEARNEGKRILELCEQVPNEAEVRGVNSEAAMLDGPTANPEAWGYRRMSAVSGRIDAAWLDDCRDERHPLWVLGTWDMLVRQHLDQHNDEPLSAGSAWAYLADHLTRLAQDPDFAFDELSRDLRGCRGYLEDVLHDSDRETYGAPCVRCHKPLLRVQADDGAEWWWCEGCKRNSNAEQYRYAVGVAYRANATRLPTADLAERIGVPASTIRRWASKSEAIEGTRIVTTPPLLHCVGKDMQGRKVYDVATAERLRDERATDAVA